MTLARTCAAGAGETQETLFLHCRLHPSQLFPLYTRGNRVLGKVFPLKEGAVYEQICPPLFLFGLLKSHTVLVTNFQPDV